MDLEGPSIAELKIIVTAAEEKILAELRVIEAYGVKIADINFSINLSNTIGEEPSQKLTKVMIDVTL